METYGQHSNIKSKINTLEIVEKIRFFYKLKKEEIFNKSIVIIRSNPSYQSFLYLISINEEEHCLCVKNTYIQLLNKRYGKVSTISYKHLITMKIFKDESMEIVYIHLKRKMNKEEKIHITPIK